MNIKAFLFFSRVPFTGGEASFCQVHEPCLRDEPWRWMFPPLSDCSLLNQWELPPDDQWTAQHEACQLSKHAVVCERWTSRLGSCLEQIECDVLREVWIRLCRRRCVQEAYDRAYGDKVLLFLLQQRLIQ